VGIEHHQVRPLAQTLPGSCKCRQFSEAQVPGDVGKADRQGRGGGLDRFQRIDVDDHDGGEGEIASFVERHIGTGNNPRGEPVRRPEDDPLPEPLLDLSGLSHGSRQLH
jgi:hypothetical protein